VIPLLIGGSQLAALWDSKIRAGLAGRRGLTDRVAAFRAQVGGKPLILFHCASAGELEALKPLLPEFDRTKVALALSYFSPSAQSALKSGAAFDFADFSPVDSAAAVREYLQALQPSVIAVTKHDVWPNMVWQAHDRGIPLFMINGNFHSGSLKHWPVIREFEATVYGTFQEIMTVSDDDTLNARRIVGERVPVVTVGDSRFDRVLERVKRKNALPDGFEAFIRNRNVVIAGSTHEEDEELLLPVAARLVKVKPDLLIVCVPHDPSRKAKMRISSICKRCGLALRDLDGNAALDHPQVLLVNRSGILADLYRAGQIAFVGGAFGKGVHSVLEPMACGLPVICGPNIAVSYEARTAVHENVLHTVRSRGECEEILRLWLTDSALLPTLCSEAEAFVQARSGTAQRIAQRLTAALHG
jgi:3-deoxy-D-manno-octulosonic-acid transferase